MKRNALLIGAFVTVALLLIVAGVLWLSGNSLFSKPQRAMIYYRGNVSGLYIGAPVAFRGVSIGQVEDIGIQVNRETLAALIAVRVRLQANAVRFEDKSDAPPPELSTLVKRGLRARLVSQSIVTGQKSIELDFVPDTPSTLIGGELGAASGRPEIPALGDRFGALIDQVADLPLRQVVEEVRETVKELRGTLGGFKVALDTAQSVLVGTGEELKQTGATARSTLRAATDAIQLIQQQASLTLASVTKLTDASRDTVLAAQPDLQRTLAGTREAAESAQLAMGRISELTAPTAPLRADLDSALRDLSQAARGLRDWSELLEEKPNALIFGSTRR